MGKPLEEPLSRETLPLTLACVFALAGAIPARAQDGGPGSSLAASLDQLRAGRAIRVAGAVIEPSRELIALYGTSTVPIWSAEAATSLSVAIRASVHDGLTPDHYHAQSLGERTPVAGARDPALDLLRTDALVRLARDLRNGRGRPTAEARAASPVADAEALVPILQRAIATGDVGGVLSSLRPQHFIYRGLMASLARLRGVEAGGGWALIPAGPSMRRDSSDARVPLLRARLRHSGDLDPTAAASGSRRFDRDLEDAVKRFQHRHGLNEDGIAGPRTLAALNVPVGERIATVRVNLERARWLARDLPERFVVVNIAGARVYVLDAGDVRFETRAIVGKTATGTPIFTANMQRIELNPTWTVPRSINGEILSSIRRNPDYLAREGMRVLTNAGREVPRGSIDYGSYTGRSFPYVFRQDPGPANALGRIKLLFPNAFNVYLHDTPARGLFSQEQRLFSHGCVRVENPVALAALVLDDPDWSVDALEAAIATGRTRVIAVRRPLPVMILYWTASADLHSELHFYPDVYGRDDAILDVLDRSQASAD